jgi:hypothetical protein
MIRSTIEVYCEAGKRELPLKRSQVGPMQIKKSMRPERPARHFAPGGWCNKKNQTLPSMERSIHQSIKICFYGTENNGRYDGLRRWSLKMAHKDIPGNPSTAKAARILTKRQEPWKPLRVLSEDDDCEFLDTQWLHRDQERRVPKGTGISKRQFFVGSSKRKDPN